MKSFCNRRNLTLAATSALLLALMVYARASNHTQPEAIHFNGNNGKLPETLAELNAWYAEPFGAPNAATFYVKAFDALELSAPVSGTLPLLGKGQMPPLGTPISPSTKSALASLLKANRSALQLLAEGAKYNHCRYPFDLMQGYDMVYRPTAKLEKAASLLSLAALYHADSNQPDEAARDVFITFRWRTRWRRSPPSSLNCSAAE